MCLALLRVERAGMTSWIMVGILIEVRMRGRGEWFLFRGPAWMMDSSKRVWYKWFSVAGN